jgi:hypothetical protein
LNPLSLSRTIVNLHLHFPLLPVRPVERGAASNVQYVCLYYRHSADPEQEKADHRLKERLEETVFWSEEVESEILAWADEKAKLSEVVFSNFIHKNILLRLL